MTTKTTGQSGLRGALASLRHEFGHAGLLSVLTNVLMLTPTIYMLQVYDRVLLSRSELTLLAVSLIALAMYACVALAEWWRTRVLVQAGQRLDAALAGPLMDADFAASLQGKGTAASARPLADLIQVRQFLTGPGILAFFDAPWAPIYIAVLFVLHPALGALALVFAAIQCLLAWQGHGRSVAPADAASKAAGVEMGWLRAKLRGAEALEAMGMLGNLWQRWNRLHGQQQGRGLELHRFTSRVTAASKFVRYAQQSLVLGLGSLLVIDGELSVGAMLAANVLMTRALAPIDSLVGLWRGLINARLAYGRLRTLLQEQAVAPAAADLPQERLRGNVQLRALSAHAAGGTRTILDGVDLALAAGSVTVVVGPSGSGKSTLARVVVGAWPHITGEALLDGRPLQDYPRRQFGAQLGYLPQDVGLFDGSIAENIARFGEIDSQAVIGAALKTGLHDIILRPPRGYDTPVDNDGVQLPGGLRQRIALARAVYGSPALVVLDEPNANLDEAGEAALTALVRQLKVEGKTVLLITHRPAILAAADRLVMLRDGKVERDGTPEQVLAEVRRAASQPLPQTP
ncbi:type I secretion system permease/ATPase [Massilia brevitalea]|uniref:type I secretion system permease/ATPase n=1 Tax=Massilia brevitalea TaxID=442526 RepID=UPI00273A052B|nr:type I secretion system permease/ATPase [Massilia brevitalea]